MAKFCPECHCIDDYLQQPHVVQYERSAANSNLLDVYRDFEDKLERYGLLHLPQLLPRLLGQALFADHQRLARDTHQQHPWDTVVTATDIGAKPTLAVNSRANLSHKTLLRLNRRQSARWFAPGADAKLPAATADPWSSYWRTVDASLPDLLPQDSPTITTTNAPPLIPPQFTAYYGIKTQVHAHQDSAWYPRSVRHWCQHDAQFAGPGNLLTCDSSAHETLQGIASPSTYIYGGGLFTSFPHHFEDFWLPSVNYLYGGQEKFWIGARASDTVRVWDAVRRIATSTGVSRSAYLPEKRYIVSPTALRVLAGVETCHVHQQAGDVVISAAGATHGGFNLGDNYAEAVNFADRSGDGAWLGLRDEMTQFFAEQLDKSVPACLLSH